MNRTTIFNRLNDNGLNEMRIANPAIKQRRIANPSQRTQRTPLLRQLAVLAVMLFAGSAWGQQYVFMYDNHYLANTNNDATIDNANTFDPNTCIWSGTSGSTFSNNGWYLQHYQADASFTLRNSTNGAWTNLTITNDDKLYRALSSNYAARYLRYNNGWTADRYNTTGERCEVVYAVTVTNVAATITNPTINGADELTATGTSDYSASGAAYRAGGYTNYYFNSTNHYFDANGNSITPANATIGAATWSLSDNAYATVNASTGVVTVSSLPESDIELTLTVTYPVTGGNPAVASGTTLTATKTITLQGTIPSAPVITVSGTTVTMATNAAGSITIRYTLDGSNPTTSTGTVYSGPIDISSQTTSPVIIKAITVRNGDTSSVTEQRVQLTLPAPVITADASAGTATISCANDSATIYYTTDGTTPSATNGTEFTDQLSGLPLMTTLQAIAVRDGWNDSPVTSTTLTLPSGTDGSTVTLFDYEPHSWSYYSDADCPIRSLNPADVKITYYGNGQTANNMTTSDVKDVPTSFGAKATGVQVSATETENTFVYYKTLERTNGEGAASKAAANGAAMYTTIPNPFQVRPTGQDNGNKSITPSSRTIVIVTARTANNSGFDNGSTLSVSWGGSIRATINSRTTTTLLAPVGETVTLTYTANSSENRDNRSTVTVYYDANGGTQVFAQYTPNTPNTNRTRTFTVAAPASQTVACGTYRGFYAWRVKSKSASITSITDVNGNTFANDIIPAETDIRINTSSEYGNEIEFEALWAQAYATTGSTNLPYAVSSSVPSAYERNFHILNTSTEASNFQKTYPCTVIGREPNSTTLNTTRAVTGGFTAAAATKFEELNITNATGSTWTANNHDLIIGRGCTGTVNIVRGMGGNTSEALDYTIRLESGVFNYVAFIAGIAGGTASGEMTLSGTNNHVTGVLGCDYDRAVEKSTTNYNYTTAPLRVTNSMSLGAQPKLTNQTESEIFNVTVKSGYFGSDNSVSDGSAARSFYIGLANEYNTGKRKLTIEGGRFNLSIAGGIDVGNTSDNAVIVRMKGGEVAGSIYGAAAHAAATGGRRFIFTGGTVGGWIAGGCNGTQTTGGKLDGKTFIYFGGTAQCNSNGSNTTIGPGNATGGNIFGAGSGNASASATATATVGEVDQSTIVIADKSMVERNVYGGGNYGYVAGTGNINKSDIYIYGGDVKGSVFGGANMQKGNIVNITMKGGLVENGIYGGSNTRGDIAGNVTIQVDGGTVGQGNAGNGIFGGGYGQTTTVNGNVSVTLGTCTAGDVTVYGDVYGGSALGMVNDATSDKTTVSLYNGTIRGGIYGGGYGPGGVAANVNGAVEVKVFGGSVLCSESDPEGEAGSGSVFGCNNAGGAPQSTVKVDIYKTDAAPGEGQYALHAVYGGGNKANYDGTPVVTIHGCNSSIEYVYGGGNASDVRGTNVTIWGGTIGYAFGGGNGYSVTGNHTNQSEAHYNPGANITIYGTHLNIYGGTVLAAFGGSNQYGTITGGVEVNVEPSTESNTGRPDCVAAYTQCAMNIGELYGGGNEAALVSSHNPDNYIDQNDINVNISCEAVVGMLFGGAKAADYVGDINLVVDGGHFEKVFGGNNKGGTITGNVSVTFNGGSAKEVYGGCNESGTITRSITVNIDSTDGRCGEFYVENVYGGGNLAAYTAPTTDGYTGKYPEVNIKQGTVRQNVYGGGFGSTAIITGTPVVTVGVSDAGKTARVWGHVFGGGNAAPVIGNTEVKILYDSYIKGNVYGGGNKATVSGNTKVNIGN